MKACVFGGSGFLGSHVADDLATRGYDVTIFDMRPSPYLQDRQKMVVGSILDKEAVNEAKAEEAQDKLDLGSMQQDDLVALADNWGVPLPEGADAAQIRGLLAEYL